MALLYAKHRLYHTVDRSEIVEEGDPRAAFLLVGEGATMAEEEAQRLGLDKYMSSAEGQPSAIQRERDALAAAEARGAHYEAQSRRAAVERLEAGEVPPAATAVGIPANVPDAAAFPQATAAAARASVAEATGEATVSEVLERANASEDRAEVQRLLDSENAQDRPRKTLVEGLERRLESL